MHPQKIEPFNSLEPLTYGGVDAIWSKNLAYVCEFFFFSSFTFFFKQLFIPFLKFSKLI